ncbi:graves disease carrier protein homolog isoform X2 [Lytechinus variegatus]|uniref:graves disease carrier protein homolog isoform X2 n=1 Tax=Lytechinus variegatus TaxID=7654 RepID=UPI001BB2C138|nr:graves disease carrier protein homolog isoform X2 [Lytechinus variegatus]
MKESADQSTQSGDEILKNFFSGGVAGCCAKTAIAPLDRVKILLQARHKHFQHLGVWSSINEVVEHEGYRALYKGNGAMMVRIFPYGAIQFMTYEWCKKKTKMKLLSGSLAGLAAVICTYPLDMIRARLAYQSRGERKYKGIIHTFYTIWHHEGHFKALYRGVTPTLIGMIPYAGAAFYTYETTKIFLLTKGPPQFSKPIPNNPTERILIIPANLCVGGIAGAIAQTITRILQNLKTVYGEHGFLGLYRGLSINYIRAIPAAAISFTVFEKMKAFLNTTFPPASSAKS